MMSRATLYPSSSHGSGNAVRTVNLLSRTTVSLRQMPLLPHGAKDRFWYHSMHGCCIFLAVLYSRLRFRHLRDCTSKIAGYTPLPLPSLPPSVTNAVGRTPPTHRHRFRSRFHCYIAAAATILRYRAFRLHGHCCKSVIVTARQNWAEL